MTRRVDTAEDITQECFFALVRNPERFDAARGTLKTYLFAIARNLILKNYRDTSGEDVLEDERLALSADPRRTLEISLAVEGAVAALPPLQQEALILFE